MPGRKYEVNFTQITCDASEGKATCLIECGLRIEKKTKMSILKSVRKNATQRKLMRKLTSKGRV
jgi:hypothetical protein